MLSPLRNLQHCGRRLPHGEGALKGGCAGGGGQDFYRETDAPAALAVAQELVAQARPRVRALQQPRDVSPHRAPEVYFHHPQVGHKRGEGVVRDLGACGARLRPRIQGSRAIAVGFLNTATEARPHCSPSGCRDSLQCWITNTKAAMILQFLGVVAAAAGALLQQCAGGATF